ncbi:MAG: HAMP domain-containing sensor histidine kinase [Rickettsiales bacterium]|nr:HAMP domain-containing sensor histidine kinase [Pseudomonadota bacterium]MDA0966582.1 HAMP domain-containing sensor histidine kinase [Pseudomonadota bacterium]MDG4543611.1 HAMP domain-containing sensor histidine kinase [Rickettsiales bacterium]MDG4545758.1 HAMP domain-containing sensor histidine kinase [Rickettsiales bacterium]MDG4547469.1 HAMP domain-containing sensor histidine kinase [Rickettsiales bacterium]
MSLILTAFLFIFFTATPAISDSFSKVVNENYAYNPLYFFLLVTVLALSVILFVLRRKIKYGFIYISSLFATKKQSEELVEAFDKLVNVIRCRDVNFREDYNNLKTVSDNKTNLLVGVSHEIRSPMHAILNFAELGKKKTREGKADSVASYFNNIEDSCTRLLKVVNSILDISAIESGNVTYKIEKNSIIDCIDNVISDLDPLIKKKKIKVDTVRLQKKNDYYFDMVKLSVVLTNLISNAVKFSPNEANITVKVEDLVCFKAIQGKCLKVSVIDEGVGIPKDELDIIFNKYNQSSVTKNNALGCGIGLAICKEVIEAHKGYIWAEKNVQSGSKFSFVIPIGELK